MDKKKMAYPTLEKIGLALHYAWLLTVMSYMPVFNAVAFFMVAQTGCGLLLAIVFGLGHNGMAVYPADQRPGKDYELLDRLTIGIDYTSTRPFEDTVKYKVGLCSMMIVHSRVQKDYIVQYNKNNPSFSLYKIFCTSLSNILYIH
jgi:hypothetical protein